MVFPRGCKEDCPFCRKTETEIYCEILDISCEIELIEIEIAVICPKWK